MAPLIKKDSRKQNKIWLKIYIEIIAFRFLRNIRWQLNIGSPVLINRRPWKRRQAFASITHFANEFLKQKKREGVDRYFADEYFKDTPVMFNAYRV